MVGWFEYIEVASRPYSPEILNTIENVAANAKREHKDGLRGVRGTNPAKET